MYNAVSDSIRYLIIIVRCIFGLMRYTGIVACGSWKIADHVT